LEGDEIRRVCKNKCSLEELKTGAIGCRLLSECMQVAICKVYETAKQDKIKGIKVPHDPHLTGKVQETRGPSRGGHAGREAAMWHITFV